MQQFEQMRQGLETLHAELAASQQDLAQERAQSRSRHANLVENLTATLQARDAALGALKRLEQYCVERGLDITGLAIYEVSNSIWAERFFSFYCRFLKSLSTVFYHHLLIFVFIHNLPRRISSPR